MRVLKGPSAIVYGLMTVGGAVDLVTRALPDGRKGTYDLAIASMATNKEHVSYGLSNEHGGSCSRGGSHREPGFRTSIAAATAASRAASGWQRVYVV